MVENGIIIDSHVALGEEHHLRLDERKLLSLMDQHAVAVAIARPLGAEVAVANDRGNKRTSGGNSRIKGLATVSPWHLQGAIEVLRAAKEQGAVGLYMHPTRQGFMPTDPIAEPLIEFASSADWPVVVHTGTYIQSDVMSVAELARRHQHLTFICDNAGFTDMWFELPGVMADCANVYLCASLMWLRAIAIAVKQAGAGRVLFGSGQPRDSLVAALKRIERLELSDNDRHAILCGNAQRIFKISI